MKRILLAVQTLFLLASCALPGSRPLAPTPTLEGSGSAPPTAMAAVQPTPTATERSAAWSEPTETPMPTDTPTPVSIPTNTPVPRPTPTSDPTPTALPPSAFSVGITGYQEHGSMFELKYDGNASDLDGLLIRLTATQGGEIKDSNEVFENFDGRHLAEMTDALYDLGLVQVELLISGARSGQTTIPLEAEYSKRHPFMRWIFGDNPMDRNVGGGFRDGHRQWDLAFSSEEYPNSVGTPILAVTSLVVENYTTSVPGREGLITNAQSYMPWVGLIWGVGHIDHNTDPSLGGRFRPGEVHAFIGEIQSGSSRPHTHMGLSTTELPPRGGPWGAETEDHWINPFSHDPFAEGAYLPTGLWLPESLPESVLKLFDEGFFENNSLVTTYDPQLSSTE